MRRFPPSKRLGLLLHFTKIGLQFQNNNNFNVVNIILIYNEELVCLEIKLH